MRESEAYSKKNIEGQPYRRKDKSVQKKILPQAPYEKIKDRIATKQAPAKKEPGLGYGLARASGHP